jgi:hypothetical protein
VKSTIKTLLFTLLLSVCIYGQRDLGTVLGTVTDAQGGAVPGAKINILEDATGLKYTVETNSNGEYIRPLLKPGTYSIEAEAPGFKKTVQRGIILTAGDRSAVNLTLTVGEVNQSVEVTTAAPVLQTESTIIGQTVNSKNVSELPLGGQRKFTYLARLAPGVLPAEQGARDAAGGGFSANGVRSNGQNNFLLNGVDNNVNVIDFINQTSYVIGPSVEAIGEMRVLTNGYNAEYGRGAGGVVNVTIKSGTNAIHGTLFEFLQNDKLDANQWESNRAGKARGPFKQNQYGAAVGGPLIKNRTFWFADFQGTNIRSTGGAVAGLGSTFVGTIPTPAMRNGDFSSLLGGVIGTDSLGREVRQGQIYDINTTRAVPGGFVRDPFLGNIIPASRFDPVAKKLMDLYPNPNQNLNSRIPASNFFNVVSGSDNTYQGDLRMDHKISDKDSIFGSLSWSEERKFNGTPLPPALDAGGFAGQNETDLARNAMISYTRVWTPSILTETRAAFSRLVTERVQANSDKDLFKEFGIKGYNPTGPLNGGLPQTGLQDYTTIGAGNWLPTKEYNNVWDFVQNLAINKGKHAFKLGAEYRPIKFPFFQVQSPHGQIDFQRDRNNNPESAFSAQTGDAAAAFLLGYPSTGAISTTNFISSEKQAWAFYVQDDWKLTSKLTLNLGVRYELFSPISERFARQSNFDIQTMTLYIPKGKDQDAALPPNFATQYPNVKVLRGTVDKYMIPWDKTDFSPRIGIAYSLMSKTVVRAGYGIFYGGEENQGGSPNRGEAVPFNSTVNLDRGTRSNFELNPYMNTYSDGFPTNVFTFPAPVAFKGVASNFRNPLVHKWNFAIQQDLGHNTSLEISYIGNHSARQLLNWDPNGAANSPDVSIPSNNLRPVPNLAGISQTATFGFGNYAGLTTKLEKRFSAGLDFLATYTWGHALANTGTTLSGSDNCCTLDRRNISSAYSTAAWDLRHNFVSSFTYDVPFGRGKRFGANLNRAADVLIGGWQTNGLISLRSGQPFTLNTRNGIGQFARILPDLVPGKNPNAAPSGGRTPERWFDTSAVTAPKPGTQGTLGLQSNTAPPQHNVDFSLFKDFKLNERMKVQFRGEAINLFNTPYFDVGSINKIEGDPSFGRISRTVSGTERHMQLALRFMF